MLFDFGNNFWLAIAVCAFIITVIVSVFVVQDEKIEKLEKKVEALEEKGDSER